MEISSQSEPESPNAVCDTYLTKPEHMYGKYQIISETILLVIIFCTHGLINIYETDFS